MTKTILALAAVATLVAACGDKSENHGPVEGPMVSTSETPRNPAVDTANSSAEAALTPGANSFTEAQAREAIEKQGYTDIGPLTQNADGIWSAPAKREATQTTVSVDYKGVVTAK